MSEREHAVVPDCQCGFDRAVVEDPVARAAPSPADIIIDRPEPESANNNPLKRNVDVGQQPHRRLEPVGLLGAAAADAARSADAPAFRARVRAARKVNAGVAFGSMLDVVNNSTPYLTGDDTKAMAVFLKSLPATANQRPFAYDDKTVKSLQGGDLQQPGAATYLGSCAACHGADGKGQSLFMPPLAGNPAVLDPDAASLVNLVLNGAEPLVVKGVPDAYRMPQFRIQLNNEQIAEVLSFVRGSWGNDAGAVSTDQVKKLRPATDPSSDQVIVLKMR
jgi:mono/diheme cytochrome c family protein